MTAMKTHDPIARLCADLGLPDCDDVMKQDWALVLDEKFRREADVYRYIEAYQNPTYGDSERQILVELMLDIVDDLLVGDRSAGERAWEALAPLLARDIDLHRGRLGDYETFAEACEDEIAILPLIRDLMRRQAVGPPVRDPGR